MLKNGWTELAKSFDRLKKENRDLISQICDVVQENEQRDSEIANLKGELDRLTFLIADKAGLN